MNITGSRNRIIVAIIAGVCAWLYASAPLGARHQARVKDIASLQGMNTAPLLGYGLVVGLNKTGDKRQTLFTTQTLTNMLTRLGVEVSSEEMKVENTAAVLVTAELLSGARTGQRIDVLASSIGDAKSLQGGTLLMTPLRDGNGEVVAIAQGPLSVGGFGGGSGSTSVQVNHLTVGRVPSGGLVQTSAAVSATSNELTLILHEPDFSTAAHMADALNEDFKTRIAKATDSSSVTVSIPGEYRDQVPQLMARLESVTVRTDASARVVINERTGTVVVGSGVTLGAASVAHGSLSVRISTKFDVSQPPPFSKTGETVVVPNETVDVKESDARLVQLEAGTTLESVTRALNALGATPRDIIAILQALKAAGALRAEIVILLVTTIDPISDVTTATSALDSRGAAPNRAETLKALVSQFESMLIGQMLREMQTDANKSEGDNYGGALSETMYGELSRVMANAGGLGLSTSLADAMSRTTPGSSPVDAIAEGQGIPRPYSPWTPGPATSFSLDRDRVSSAYGVRRDPISGDTREHKGVDIPAALGDDIRSVKSGKVIESGSNGGYGNTIVVDHGDGVTTRYAHLSALDVQVGERVKAGQVIGLAGQTGRATGTHLHLEVRKDGVAIDPLGALATRLIGKVMPGIERKSISADDTHGASR